MMLYHACCLWTLYASFGSIEKTLVLIYHSIFSIQVSRVMSLPPHFCLCSFVSSDVTIKAYALIVISITKFAKAYALVAQSANDGICQIY